MNRKPVRTAKWAEYSQGVAVAVGFSTRRLRGSVGEKLKARGRSGTLKFVAKPPRRGAFLEVMGGPKGLLVLYYANFWWDPIAEYVPMCPAWRKRLGITRKGQTRWMQIKPVPAPVPSPALARAAA